MSYLTSNFFLFFNKKFNKKVFISFVNKRKVYRRYHIFLFFFYLNLCSILFFSNIPSIFLQKNFRLVCGKVYFFIIKEKTFNFGILNRLEKYWFYTNNKIYNTPFHFFEHRFRCGMGILVANTGSYWIFRVIIFRTKIEFLVFFFNYFFINLFSFSSNFDNYKYYIFKKMFWLRRIRARKLRFEYYNCFNEESMLLYQNIN